MQCQKSFLSSGTIPGTLFLPYFPSCSSLVAVCCCPSEDLIQSPNLESSALSFLFFFFNLIWSLDVDVALHIIDGVLLLPWPPEGSQSPLEPMKVRSSAHPHPVSPQPTLWLYDHQNNTAFSAAEHIGCMDDYLEIWAREDFILQYAGVVAHDARAKRVCPCFHSGLEKTLILSRM